MTGQEPTRDRTAWHTAAIHIGPARAYAEVES